MQPGDGGHGAHAALDLDLPVFYLGLCHICLGCMDPAEFWHAGQLSVVGHHRLSGTRSDDSGFLDYRLDYFLVGFLAAGFLAADRVAVLALTAAFLAVLATAFTAALASSASTRPS